MKRDLFTLPLDFPDELVIDNFAGGGGTSTGLEAALGRPVDIAINHDPQALAMHALNHPYTQHLCQSVWDVNPILVTRNQPVGLVWLSPDCKDFSKAKGGTPVSKHIRGLAWVGMRWIALCRPRVLILENVEEFQDWGPLIVSADGTARPDPARRGRTFESFVRQLRAHGYTVEWRERRACDDGAPTIRKRLFLVARRDGLTIDFPAATHAAPESAAVRSGQAQPWRTAAECLDFSIPAESIFDRKRPLVANTLRRVAKGLWRHVLSNPQRLVIGNTTPFITEHANASSQRTMAANEPLRTICAQVKGGHFSVVSAQLLDVSAPKCGTDPVSEDPSARCLASAFLEQANGGFYDGDGRSLGEPTSTITASGAQQRLVTACLIKYYGTDQNPLLSEPMHTVTTKDRLGLVQLVRVEASSLAPAVRARARQCAQLLRAYLPERFEHDADCVLVDGQYVLVDITLRMLSPRELYRAQGFPESYVIDRIPDPAVLFKDGVQQGDPRDMPTIRLSAKAQVRMCGNSVAPPQAEALVRANFQHEQAWRGAAAA